MSNPLPENEVPVTLRASTALSVRREQAGSSGNVPAILQVGHEEDVSLTAPALTVGALAVVFGMGWLFQRRHRLARHEADAAQAEPATPDTARLAAPDRPAPDDVMAQVAAQFEQQAASLQPQQSFPAPLEHRHRHPSRMGVDSQKRLIKGLMWVRTAAAGAAMVAAIAIVVFWAIETTDLRAGETGLTKPLLLLLLAGWVASWGAGQLANLLHRAFFGRVHPKFDN